MNAEDIIREVQENASEWIEMSNDPSSLIARILAIKIVKLQDHIHYLEKRLKHVSISSNSGY